MWANHSEDYDKVGGKNKQIIRNIKYYITYSLLNQRYDIIILPQFLWEVNSVIF